MQTNGSNAAPAQARAHDATSGSEGRIGVTREGAVVTVTLDRPAKLNALTRALWADLGTAIDTLSADDTVRCIVLRGAGERAFSPGNDISEFENARANVEQARAYGAVMHRTIHALEVCRHPLVAMIHGICVGGGLELASMCDVRVCGASSRFGVPINRLGLVMAHAEMAGLIRVAGEAVALELLLEGRIIDAEEALRKGLVSRVVPDAEVAAQALATAGRIAAGAPLVARWHKRFARRLADPTPLSASERDEGFACFGTEDFKIGYRAFLDKVPPAFKGR